MKLKNFLHFTYSLLFLLTGWALPGFSQANISAQLPPGSCTLNYTRTFGWTIDKSVTPDAWDLFKGDQGTSQYTVTLTKDNGTDAVFFTASICVSSASGSSESTQNLSITALMQYPVGNNPDWVVQAPVDVSSNPVLDPGEEACYDVLIYAPPGNQSININSNYRLTVMVHVDNGNTPEHTCVDKFLSGDLTLINDEVTVDDTNGSSWTFSSSGSQTYTQDFTCNTNEGEYENTATITETDQSASATVTVNCYDLEVEKTANTSLDRTYAWTIDKTEDNNITSVILSTGQAYTLNYNVAVDVDGGTDSNWGVTGAIYVHNPAPVDAVITSISDLVSPDITGTVACDVLFPHTLTAGSTLECSYTASLPDASTRTNTATATLQNYGYDYQLNATAGGTTDFSGSAEVDFSGAAVNEIDECVDVTDSQAGLLGTLCLVDAPHTYEYQLTANYAVCGTYTFTNTATYTTNDTEAEGSDSWNVSVDVPCGGCTLTQGYWKTHSALGPAPYDNAWLLLGDKDGDGISEGQSEVFFVAKNGVNGKTYYQVLWTSPSSGYYYSLAHQYIAAKLNILNGAATTADVTAAINWCETQFFNMYKLANAPNNKKSTALAKAAILDAYNNGITGPGHCSETMQPVNSYSSEYEDNGPLTFATDLSVKAYPLPFSDELTLEIAIPYDCELSLEMYDAKGQRCYSLPSTRCFAKQTMTVKVDGSRFGEGVYFYRLKTNEETKVGQMIKISSR